MVYTRGGCCGFGAGLSLVIKDIARLAGVSTATVSRALSHPDRVSEETRALVMGVVERHGYRVNSFARSLRKQRAGRFWRWSPIWATRSFR
ncbi:LacI family DNA-binding transcriptional regulator [Gemmobacter lanyuensis]